jgi:hypothetical protein
VQSEFQKMRLTFPKDEFFHYKNTHFYHSTFHSFIATFACSSGFDVVVGE